MRRAVTLTASVVFIGFLVACGSRTKTSAPLPPAPKPVTPTTEKEVVKATKKTEAAKAAPKLPTKEMLAAYQKNPAVAEDAYLLKRYRFEGEFREFVNESVFLWNNREEGGKVLVGLPRKELKKIQRGDTVTVEGTLLLITPNEFNLPDFSLGNSVVIQSVPTPPRESPR